MDWCSPINGDPSALSAHLGPGNGGEPFHDAEHFADGSAFDLDTDDGMAGCAVVQIPSGPGWFDPGP
eukprot:2723515-Pyramimonas_sp.AAC.1